MNTQTWRGWLASVLFGLAVLAIAPAVAHAEDPIKVRPPNGLALTPPMGWNSWNRFGCDIDEAKIRAEADALVASGMKDAGYSYLIIDDCWQVSRDGHGDILADAKRFPSGIKALSDYIHNNGLKFGIYSDAGDFTCQGRPASRGHEYQDAAQYARWGVDYLKYDWCNTENVNAQVAYETMADALRATGRPIVFSLCEWGLHQPWKWGAAAGGNLWRTTNDIWDSFNVSGHYGEWSSVLDIIDQEAPLAAYAGPGHWNDPDMLEVGNGGMSLDEYRTHFGMWAMLSAPLIAGNDVAHMTPDTAKILMAKEIIAIDQDPVGSQARRYEKSQTFEVWKKNLSGGRTAILVLNKSDQPQTVTTSLGPLDMSTTKSFAVRDAWAESDQGLMSGEIKSALPPHGSKVWVLTPAK